MRRALLTFALAALSVVGSTNQAIAQDMKSARGTITGMGGGTLAITMRDGDLRFMVDDQTVIEAAGAGTMARRAQAAGKPGPKLSDVLKAGQAVDVTYYDWNGMPHAKRIRRVASASFKPADDNRPRTSHGTVKAFAGDALTISGGSGGRATFLQTFIIDANTKVFGKGFGTAAAKNGGRLPASQLIASGDWVSVSYSTTGSALRAANVRVITKAPR